MKISVVGLGKSGISAINFLKKQGDEIFVSEKNDSQNSLLINMKNSGIIEDFEIGEHTQKIFENKDLVVLSPGVRTDLEIFKNKNVEIISELELGFCALNTQNIIAVTGTNGKTTTVHLLHHILEKLGKKSFLCGNVGTPITEIAKLTDKDSYVVVEVSSYQLEKIDKFKAKSASVLNVTPDHLYRYKDMEDYALTKFKIFQKNCENIVLNSDDEYFEFYKKQLNGKNFLSFSLKTKADIYYDSSKKQIVMPSKNLILDVSKMKIFGLHNVANVMATILLLKAFKLDMLDIVNAIYSFEGLEHRLELAGIFNEVKYINDSKATNVDSTKVALESFADEKKLILLLGGEHKGYPYSSLVPLINSKVKKLILFGEAKNIMFEEFLKFEEIKDRIVICEGIEKAILESKKQAVAGDIVLLSPACASFDEFNNYEERGRFFKEKVRDETKH